MSFCLVSPDEFALDKFARWLLKSELAVGVPDVRKCLLAVTKSVKN